MSRISIASRRWAAASGTCRGSRPSSGPTCGRSTIPIPPATCTGGLRTAAFDRRVATREKEDSKKKEADLRAAENAEKEKKRQADAAGGKGKGKGDDG